MKADQYELLKPLLAADKLEPLSIGPQRVLDFIEVLQYHNFTWSEIRRENHFKDVDFRDRLVLDNLHEQLKSLQLEIINEALLSDEKNLKKCLFMENFTTSDVSLVANNQDLQVNLSDEDAVGTFEHIILSNRNKPEIKTDHYTEQNAQIFNIKNAYLKYDLMRSNSDDSVEFAMNEEKVIEKKLFPLFNQDLNCKSSGDKSNKDNDGKLKTSVTLNHKNSSTVLRGKFERD
jgi:hypothetical protein